MGKSQEEPTSVQAVFTMPELCIHILKFHWAVRILKKFLVSRVCANRITRMVGNAGGQTPCCSMDVPDYEHIVSFMLPSTSMNGDVLQKIAK